MKAFFLTFSLITTWFSSPGQKIQPADLKVIPVIIDHNAAVYRNPASNDNAQVNNDHLPYNYDFSRLKQLLSDKRIVLLGEQTHGDGATFKAKVDLIMYLHQELGFDMVVFESPMYEIYKASQLWQTSNPKDTSLIKESIFDIWSATWQFDSLLKYMTGTWSSARPLELAGFDFQEGSLFEEHFFDDVKEILARNNIGLEDSTIYRLEETFFGGSDFIATNRQDSINFYEAYEEVKSGLKKCDPDDKEVQIMLQTLISFLANIELGAEIIKGKEHKVQNPRDLQMAQNLIALADIYPQKKIIGWGASYHFANEIEKYENTATTQQYIAEMDQRMHPDQKEASNLDSMLYGAIPMGLVLKEHFGNQIFSMSFSSGEGSFGIAGEAAYPLPVPPEGSIEYMLDELGYTAAFIDYSQMKNETFYSSALGNIPIKASWQDIFDGLFYIRTSYPAEFLTVEDVNLDDYQKQEGIQISGRITEKGSQTGIPYAHISIENSSIGTVANDEGYFKFNFSQKENPDGQILFSSIGFKTRKIAISDLAHSTDSLIMRLEKETTLLDEIIITEKLLSPKQIVKKARKSLEANYYQHPYNQELFHRIKRKSADSITFMEEASVFIYNKAGYKSSGQATRNLFGQVLQFRNTTENPNKNKWDGVGGLWLIFSHDLIMDKKNVLYKTSSYKLRLTDITRYNGEEVYEISFDNKRPSAYNTGYGYPAPLSSHGKLYIKVDDYAIIRYEHCVERKPHTPKKNPDHQLINRFVKNIQTYKQYNGHYFISYARQVFSNDRIDLDTGDSTYQTHRSELLSTKVISDNMQPLKKPITNIKVGMKVVEDKEFWNRHNIVMEDQEEQAASIDPCER